MEYSRSASLSLAAWLSLLIVGCSTATSATSQPTVIQHPISIPEPSLTPVSTSMLTPAAPFTAVPTRESGLTEAAKRAHQLAETGVTHNIDWTPYVEEVDGVQMALVPAGCFMMGSTDEQLEDTFQGCEGDTEAGPCDEAPFKNEQPVHQVCFEEPFWIDVTEVTNSQFAALDGQAASAGRWTDADRPRENVTWEEADAFCQKRNARLLTEAEWEYAARGPDGLIFPWGNQFIADNVVYSENSSAQTGAAGSKPAGMSWVGALDLSGNVWEWVADWYGDYLSDQQVNPGGPDAGEYRVLRGGSWSRNVGRIRTANRGRAAPGDRHYSYGFRCEKAVSALPSTVSTPVPAPPTVGVTRNTDWTPHVEEINGVKMALVPAGCFMMGSTDEQVGAAFQDCQEYQDDCDRAWFEREEPMHEVCFDKPFWIDVYEVTQAQFAQFDGESAEASYFTGADLPREQITWAESDAFCQKRGARLLTEAEWEFAARGPDGLVYPWGNSWDGTLSIWDARQTMKVGSKPGGISWVGALDLSGNVWEWVADWYEEYSSGKQIDPVGPDIGQHRVLRGGSWCQDPSYTARAPLRMANLPGNWGMNFGFRCGKTVSALPSAVSTPVPESPTVVVTHNTDWTPHIEEINEVKMALVPAGCFMMGSTDEQVDDAMELASAIEFADPGAQESWFDAEQPPHKVCFDKPFWIDVTEVTNKQYGTQGTFQGDDMPREWVTWNEAFAHCQSRGARLPTEAEWEYAARGPDGLVYPWGNEFSADKVTLYAPSNPSASPSGEPPWEVGSNPGGVSWVGVLDMSGNVAEFVNDWYSETYYAPLTDGVVNPQGPTSGAVHAERGGSFFSFAFSVRAAFRSWNRSSDEPYNDRGFRCAHSN